MKEAGYKAKFDLVKPWLVEIIETVKKDLKHEHLKVDREFCRRYFLGKNAQQVLVDEMAVAYEKDIQSGNEGLGEFIATRWLLKHTDIYYFFEERVKKINPDFENIQEFTVDQSLPILDEALKNFGPIYTYIFTVFNEVAFPKEIYERLRKYAEDKTSIQQQVFHEEQVVKSLDAAVKKHERELNATRDRFEKKICGLQRKYLNDMNALKKQVSTLQKKLSEKS